MASIKLKAYAKINLSLDVLRRREDGYHDLRMVMQSIGLHDQVELEIIDEGIRIETNNGRVPAGPENIAYKAAKLMINKYCLKKGLKIIIDKRIPVAAGLAGGSTDAAAVLKGVNDLFDLRLSMQELLDLGKSIGADVPFCLAGGTMLAEGIGEKLTALKSFAGFGLLLLAPKAEVSAAWVYRNLKLEKIKSHPDTRAVLKAIDNRDLNGLIRNTANVLEEVTIPKHPVVKQAKDRLMELGAAGCLMSGSGPSVFGFFTGGGDSLKEAYIQSQDSRWYSYVTETI